MFSPLFIVGLVLLLGGLFWTRYLAERANKLLSADEKVKLLDSFSMLRVFSSLPLLLIFFSFFGVSYLPPRLIWPGYLAAWGLIAVYFVVVHRVIFRRLGALGINAEYQRAQRRARWPVYCGFLLFFAATTLAPFVHK